MIHQNNPFEKASSAFNSSFKTLKIGQLLRQAGIRKANGISVLEVFQFIFLLGFQGKNLYRFLNSDKGKDSISKNTYYRFLNEATYGWRRFLTLLACRVIASFDKLTTDKRVRSFILDDSIVTRNRSKQVELMARIYDHSTHRYQKGFSMLALAWTDGFSTVPVDFAMLSSSNAKTRIKDCAAVDKRSHGFKRRQEALRQKPTVATEMLANACEQGIVADYVLMDTWFTHEPLIASVLDIGLDVIGMVKDLKQKYTYQNKQYTLKQLRNFMPKNAPADILGTIVVSTKKGIPVRLVFIKNRNDKKQWLTILSTDLTISEEEIVRIYGNRWSIEVFFKASKSFLKLGTEFQGRSYDMLISHTTIVFARFILLEWQKRQENDYKTFGELFFMCCDEVQDMDFKTALVSLMKLFKSFLKTFSAEATEDISCQLAYWLSLQPSYIKGLMANT